MDPQDPTSFRSKTQKLSTGLTYHYIDEKPANCSKDTPVILALHGFPDRWYGWRYQIGPWVRRGWRVIVPDALGYGETDKPTELSLYTTKNLANDIVALLDAEDISRVIVVAHDWGAYTGWRIALWHPERVRMIACLSVPFYPPAPVYIPPPVMAKRVPLLAYQLYLGSEDAVQEIQERPGRLVDTVFQSGGGGIEWAKEGRFRQYILGEPDKSNAQNLLNPAEFKFYEESFSKPMHGPLAYYKTSKLRFEEEKEAKLPSRLPASIPALFLRGTEDPSSPPDHARRSKNFVPSLKTVTLRDAGHWLMVERKEEVTTIVGDWIEETLKSEKTYAKL